MTAGLPSGDPFERPEVASAADNRAHMSTLLGLIETPGQYQELVRLAELLSRSASIKQLHLVYDCGPATPQVIEGLERSGAECINAGNGAVDRMRQWAKDGRPSPWKPAVHFVRNTVRPLWLLHHFRKLIRDHRVDLVIVAEDSVAARSRALVEAASQCGLPVLLVPFTIPNPLEAVRILGRGRAYQVSGPLKRAFVWARPGWAFTTDEGRYIRLPLAQAIASELARLRPARPWIDNATPPLTIAVESRAMMQHYLRMGVQERQLVLTGSLADHTLEAALGERSERRARLRQRFALSDKPLLLCAMPPDQLTRAGAVSEFGSYQELIAAWACALAAVADRFAVVVRPHPRLDDAMLGVLRKAGLAICWDDTASLIPLCDLYVAAISATIRWAIACGRPVVDYDVYQYRFNDYEGVPGNVTVGDIDSFNCELCDLAGHPERLAALTTAQSAVAPDWGCLDGGSGDRIRALVDRLLASKPNSVQL
jgi:hypothetical protein